MHPSFVNLKLTGDEDEAEVEEDRDEDEEADDDRDDDGDGDDEGAAWSSNDCEKSGPAVTAPQERPLLTAVLHMSDAIVPRFSAPPAGRLTCLLPNPALRTLGP